MYSLTIFFAKDEQPPRVLNKTKAGQTLLEVCLANGINLPHTCGGICHCTTCHVFVDKGSEHIEPAERRERDFLVKVKIAGPQSRLACQCLLREGKGEIEIMIP